MSSRAKKRTLPEIERTRIGVPFGSPPACLSLSDSRCFRYEGASVLEFPNSADLPGALFEAFGESFEAKNRDESSPHEEFSIGTCPLIRK